MSFGTTACADVGSPAVCKVPHSKPHKSPNPEPEKTPPWLPAPPPPCPPCRPSPRPPSDPRSCDAPAELSDPPTPPDGATSRRCRFLDARGRSEPSDDEPGHALADKAAQSSQRSSGSATATTRPRIKRRNDRASTRCWPRRRAKAFRDATYRRKPNNSGSSESKSMGGSRCIICVFTSHHCTRPLSRTCPAARSGRRLSMQQYISPSTCRRSSLFA